MATFTIDRFSAKTDRLIGSMELDAASLSQAIELAVGWMRRMRTRYIDLRFINRDNRRKTWVMIDNVRDYFGQHVMWCYFHDYEGKEQTLTFKI